MTAMTFWVTLGMFALWLVLSELLRPRPDALAGSSKQRHKTGLWSSSVMHTHGTDERLAEDEARTNPYRHR